MPLLYLIRHPRTQVDLSAPADTWGLSAEGEAQTAALLAAPFWRQVAAIFPSTERKAILPAEAAGARYGIPVKPIADLREVDRSAYSPPDQPGYETAVAAFLTQPAASAHGWETASAALERFQRGIKSALAQVGAADNAAIVAHGLVLSVYMAHLRGEAPSLARWKALGFCTVAAVDRATMQLLADFTPAPYNSLPVPDDIT